MRLQRSILGVIASTLIIASVVYPQNIFAAGWSLCKIGAKEKQMIGTLTRMRISLDDMLAGTYECLVVTDNTIAIRYKNGEIMGFGIDDEHVIALDNETTKKHKEAVPENSDSAQSLIGQLFIELMNVWYESTPSDQLMPEDFLRADLIVADIFAMSDYDEIPQAVINAIGMRGNRYLSMIEKATSLAPKAIIVFYEGYLARNRSFMKSEDIPTEDEIQKAVEKLAETFQINEFPESFHLGNDTRESFEKFSPLAYEDLLIRGIIVDD